MNAMAMTRWPLLGLGLLAAGLSALIAHQLDRFGSAEPPSLAAPRRPPPSTPAAVPAPDRSGEWAARSLARPLFSPDRRPAPATAAGGSGPAEPPRLTGILVTPAGRQAIFAAGERPLVVGEGGSVGAYTVQSISGEQVTVSGPSGPLRLRPSFSPAGADDRDGASASRPPAGTEAAFRANPAPSGLDILRNAARQAGDGAPAGAGTIVPGVDVTAGGPPSSTPVPGAPGRPGALPAR